MKVNLAEVSGTGEDGRVTKRDVETFAQARSRTLSFAESGSRGAAIGAKEPPKGEDEEELLPL